MTDADTTKIAVTAMRSSSVRMKTSSGDMGARVDGGLPPPLRGRVGEGGEPQASPRYPHPEPSPTRAGESHLILRSVLHWLWNWILRTTPPQKREWFHGEIPKHFPRGAGSAPGQRQAQSGGYTGHCLGGGAVRCGRVRRHGGVWLRQAGIAAGAAAAGPWNSEPRYVQPGIPIARSEGFRPCVSPLHGRVCQEAARRGGGGRQSLAGRLRARTQNYAVAAGQRVGGRGASCHCTASGAQPQ